MKITHTHRSTSLALSFVSTFTAFYAALLSTCLAQGTAFTYQGRLNDGVNPTSGIYDLRFAIYDASGGGTQHGPALTNAATAVSNGLFTVVLNFGYDVFTGAPRWLELGVRTNGGSAFIPLAPRQPVTPAPYALHAAFAGDIEPGANVSFSANGVVSFQAPTPFYLGPFATNLVQNLNAQYLAGRDAGQFWWLGGNSGQLPGDYVLGTLDNSPLEFKVNGQRALRVEPNATSPNLIGGFSGNVVSNGFVGAVIGGGGQANNPNRVGADYATVLGGYNNTATGFASTAIGVGNTARGNYSTVIGAGNSGQGIYSMVLGVESAADGDYATAMGVRAQANHAGSFVWADLTDAYFLSTADNQFNVRAYGGARFVTDGAGLTVDGQLVLAGLDGSALTTLNASQLTTGNVPEAALNNAWKTGGNSGTSPGNHFIGTSDNQALEFKVNNTRALRLEPNSQGIPNVILGSPANGVVFPSIGATISGGATNWVKADFSTVGGGGDNSAEDMAATVGGGLHNTASGELATVAGGYVNTASGTFATVGGGDHNTASDYFATVGGGDNNTASGLRATIGGGALNIAAGLYATIPGGASNFATNYAFAAGNQAGARHTGAFVWADFTSADFNSTGDNQFLIRASGGVGIGTTAPQAPLHVWGRTIVNGADQWDVNNNEGDFRVGSDTHRFKIGVAQTGAGAGDVWMRAHGGTARLLIKANGGTTIFSNEAQTNGVSLAAGGGSWTSVSDRHAKENFEPVDAQEVLAKVAALPLSSWNYKSQDVSIRHVGPMAQDFKAAFGLGESETGITTVDADGVALAAIQGLNAKVESGTQKAEAEMAKLRAELKRRDAENAALKARLERLEQLLTNQLNGDTQ